MATAKKKTTTIKKVAKTSVSKRAASKSVASRKNVPKKRTATPEMRSFHVAKDVPPFTTFKVTRQTLYWVILVSFIVFAQLWIISLQVEVASLLDAQQAQLREF